MSTSCSPLAYTGGKSQLAAQLELVMLCAPLPSIPPPASCSCVLYALGYLVMGCHWQIATPSSQGAVLMLMRCCLMPLGTGKSTALETCATQ